MPLRTLRDRMPRVREPRVRDTNMRSAPTWRPIQVDASLAEKNPSKVQAQLLDAQRTDFENRYKPIENQLIQMSTTPQEGDPNSPWAKAGADAQKQALLTRGEFMRNLSGTGTELSTRQSNAVDRRMGLSQARSIANAENTSRAATIDQNRQTQADLIGIGRKIQGSANSALSDAAGMQAQRESASDAAKQAEKAQTQNAIMSVGGLGLGLAAMAFL